jgi:hypothetical protein
LNHFVHEKEDEEKETEDEENCPERNESKNECRLLHRCLCVFEDFQSERSEINKAKDSSFAF